MTGPKTLYNIYSRFLCLVVFNLEILYSTNYMTALWLLLPTIPCPNWPSLAQSSDKTINVLLSLRLGLM